MSFFDADPERPRLKFKESNPFGKSTKSDPPGECDGAESVATHSAETALGGGVAVSLPFAPPSEKKNENEKGKEKEKENEARGIATEGSKKSKMVIRSARKLLPKRVSFVEEETTEPAATIATTAAATAPRIAATATSMTTTTISTMNEPPVIEGDAMDIVPANAEEEASKHEGEGKSTPSLSSTPTQEDLNVERKSIEKSAASTSSSSSSSTSTVVAYQQETDKDMDVTTYFCEALASDEEAKNDEDAEETDVDNHDTSEDIMETVKHQQACVAREVEDIFTDCTSGRKEQALATAQSLASDPLVAVSIAMSLLFKQTELLSASSALVKELESALARETGGKAPSHEEPSAAEEEEMQ